MKSCPSCLSAYEGNYCSNCGQKYLQTPYSIKNIIVWLTEAFDFNQVFFLTSYHLITRPKFVISKYLSGSTRIYVSPVKYFLLVCTILFLLGALLDAIPGNFQMMIPGDAYETYLVFFITGIFLWPANWLLFAKSGFSIVEHLLIVLYQITGLFLMIPLAWPIWYAEVKFGAVKEEAAMVLSWFPLILIYNAWFYVSVFKGNKFGIFLKSMLIFFLAIVAISGITVLRR